MQSFTIATTVKEQPPKLPYEEIKNAILGTQYGLSLVFAGRTRTRTLNQLYRQKKYVPNVLSFPLDAHHGEIYITPEVARREAPKRGMTYSQYVGFLFIHGLLHLKGHHHGDTMEKAEKRYQQMFDLLP